MPFPGPGLFPSTSLFPESPSFLEGPDSAIHRSSIPALYSGIVVNQNQVPASVNDFIPITDKAWRYQEVFLPKDFVRGTEAGHEIIPPLSGWQLLVGVDPGSQATATLDWIAQYQIFGIGWVTMASGTTTGVHTEADRVWMDLIFETPADMNLDLITKRMRFGFRNSSGVNKVWYSNPNPLALQGFVKLYGADGVTAIQDGGVDLSVCFRVLALTVDSGVDFLGNSYRSALRSNVSDNTNTVDGAKVDSIYMSEPAPSRFAVKSLYYDVRQPTPITYGVENFVANPSFEIGTTGWATTDAWFLNTGATLSRVTSQSKSGTAAAQVVTTSASTSQGIAISLGVLPIGTYRYSAWIRGAAGGETVSIQGGQADVTQTGTNLTLTTSWQRVSFTFVTAGIVPCYIAIRTTTASARTFFVDSVMATKGSTLLDYFDGDFPGYRWITNPHQSPSIQFTEGTITDDQVVIDDVLIDPVTPGVWFSIYYSSEGDRPDSEADWENKLWTRVPGSYQAKKRESHKLPKPILAKYVKIEFTHLQAKSYDPGDFAKPVTYKKHPKWVLDYFLARLESEQQITDKLSIQRVAVIYDALDFAFNYYLDDLKQTPDQPVEIDPAYTDSVLNFLTIKDDKSDQVDQSVIDQISLALNPYRSGTNAFAKSDYLPTVVAGAVSDFTQTTPLENGLVDSNANLLRNLEVVRENDYPVMFFYVTCRHKYREIEASFTHNRAYFVGIREIAFTRDRYAVAFDNDQYIEPAGDVLNSERNDFTQIDGIMTV